MRSSKYDAVKLAPIVASSTSISDVIRKLGLVPNGGNHRMISGRIRQAGLDTSHFGWGKLRASVSAISTETLTTLIEHSTSFAQVLAKLDLPTEGRAHRELSKRVAQLGIDTSHFRGPGWSRGETKHSHASLARGAAKRALTDEEVFIENGPIMGGSRIIQRLLAKGWSYSCALCGISEWRGRALVLHVDHINGINNDHRLVNLRLLCPNCHSQTDTYCKRPRPAASRASEACDSHPWYTGSTRAWRNLVYALDLGSSGRKPVGVRVPPLAQTRIFASPTRRSSRSFVGGWPGGCTPPPDS